MRNNTKQDPKSFWSSLPGFLTALAGLITAVTGLYLALHSGSSEKPKTVTSPSAVIASPKTGVQIVRIETSEHSAKWLSHGFFTPNGYIVAGTDAVRNASNISVTWVSEGIEQRRQAQVLRSGELAPQATLLQLNDTPLVRRDMLIRFSGTLQIGEKVARYMGPDESAFGAVSELYAQREITDADTTKMTLSRLLVVKMATPVGSLGAPIIDSEGKLVAMLAGGNSTETICIPIEEIKGSFPEAF